MSQVDSGIIYVAFGYEYVLMALHSAETSKTANPSVKYAIVTNSIISDIKRIQQVFSVIQEVDVENEFNRLAKTSANTYSPFARTLLLDCDTEVNGDLSPMFDCLDRFDVIAKMNSEPTMKDYKISALIPGDVFPMWNTGAIFFNAGSQANRLFSEWQRIFLEMQVNRDQPAFARMIYENPDIKLLSVNCIWNADQLDRRLFSGKRSKRKIRIWHYREPHQFLPAARAIYELHTEIGSIFAKNNQANLAVADVERRYQIMLKAPLRTYIFGLKTKKSLKRSRKTVGVPLKKNE